MENPFEKVNEHALSGVHWAVGVLIYLGFADTPKLVRGTAFKILRDAPVFLVLLCLITFPTVPRLDSLIVRVNPP
jgi:hypothetical protein